jgi:hypothetical protein
VVAGLPKSTHPGTLAAMREIYNAEDIDGAQVAIKTVEISPHPALTDFRCTKHYNSQSIWR